jgi:hypothetical protein
MICHLTIALNCPSGCWDSGVKGVFGIVIAVVVVVLKKIFYKKYF